MNPREQRAHSDHSEHCAHEPIRGTTPTGARTVVIPNWIIAIATALGSAAALISAIKS